MINRVLIRIKVVQLLYSHLLVENPFTLQSLTDSPTREKRFAYTTYLDVLLLMIRLSERIKQRGGDMPLYSTRFISRLRVDEKLKSLAARYNTEDFPFKNIENELADKIKESGIYKKFLKSETRGSVIEDNVWKDLLDLIILKDESMLQIIRNQANYTLRGYDRFREMLNDTFTSFFASADNLPDALKTLELSLSKARELYMMLLYLPILITDMRNRQIEDSQRKYLKTEEDINPNMRFVENEFVQALRENTELAGYINSNQLTWVRDDDTLVRSLLNEIMQSEVYKEYMAFPATDFSNDCEFWKDVIKHIVLRSPSLLETLEDRSVFWNDDLDVIGTFVLKTVRRFQDGQADAVMPKYKDEEDARFGAELFSLVIKNKEYYRGVIDSTVDRRIWESDRLAFMDVVIVMTAMAEILNFPKIPVTVSINEYIEIAKSYSSAKSGVFVHGLLASIIAGFKKEGKLQK
ncbi:MAG: hypothetical protein K2N03_02750 [Muribaculaceae bacterium]|nr:hypothetical protein [Muribaculaceae bacterium]